MVLWLDCTHGVTSAKVLAALEALVSHGRTLHEVQRFMGSKTAQRRAHAVFEVLAQAEAAAHEVTLDEMHFHEVGRLTNLSRVVGIFAAFDMLGIEKWYCSPPVIGNGTVVCSHGELSIPAPATAYILERYGIPISPAPDTPLMGELTTPTGAALLTQADGFCVNPPDSGHLCCARTVLS